ncbi:MAG TPA: hypothetical protein PLP11_04755, partial [Bacteroidales bacterium]|nr:hypothetical protein [Bacteroidales bacterium]
MKNRVFTCFTRIILIFLVFVSSSHFVFGQNVSLDTLFGDSGIVVTPNTRGMMKSILLKDNGILCVGYNRNLGANNLEIRLVIAKYTPDGSLDNSFGDGGIVQDSIYYGDMPYSVIEQPNGKFTIAGVGFKESPNSPNYACGFVARYNFDGEPDVTFGHSGKVKFDSLENGNGIGLDAFMVILLPDNKYLVGGTLHNNYTGVVKLNPNGIVDTAFGYNGYIILDASYYNIAFGDMAFLNDGTILICGIDHSESNNTKAAIIKINQDGSINNDFGVNGKVVIDVNEIQELFPEDFEHPVKIRELDNNQILVAGNYRSTNHYLFLLHANGSLINEFGENGIFKEEQLVPLIDFEIQNDGKILLGGSFYQPDPYDYDFMVKRLNADGSNDLTFNFGQTYIIYNPERIEYFDCIHIQESNKIVLTGASKNPNGDFNFTLV